MLVIRAGGLRMASSNEAGPVADRIELVDALRGFALLGIFLANILVFSGWILTNDAGRLALAGADAVEWQHAFHKFFIDGKFYTLFSLLFGAGFALQLERLTRRGADGLAIYRRRVLILLGIGLIHEWLIWDGDILVLYALLGLILPLFHRMPGKWLLAWSAILVFAVPMVGVALVKAMGWAPDAGLFALSDRIARGLGVADPFDGVTWLRRDDFMGWFAWIMSGPFFSWGLKVMSWRIFKVLGVMLLGMWVGRRLAAGTLLNDRRLLWCVFAIGLLVGLPAGYAYTLGNQQQTSSASLIGTVPLALAYAAGFALLWPHAKGLLGLFAWPGRMALTNYLMQSVVSIITFYGIFFGRIGYWPPAKIYAFAVGVFALQMIFSRWWLARHDQGPVEAAWRRWTYGNRPVAQAVPAV